MADMARAYITVYVFDLPITTKKKDCEEHFEALLPGCQPAVSELVVEPKTKTKVTTVTFEQKNAKSCDTAIRILKANATFTVKNPHRVSKIGISSSFKGIRTLACRSQEPSFEYVHIHRS